MVIFRFGRTTPAALALVALATVAVGGQQRVARDQRNQLGVGTSEISGIILTPDGSIAVPLGRARVTVAAVEGGQSRTTLTDAEGRFAFPTLPAGRYTLAASKPGYLRAAYGARRYDRPGTPISLAEGQQITDLQLVVARGAVVTGRLTDEHGLPAPGVNVRVLERRTVLGEPELRPVRASGGLFGESTDDRGVYRLYGLPPGDYVVVAAPRLNQRGEIRAMTDREIRQALQQAQLPVAQREALAQEAARAAAEDAQTVGFAPVYYPGTSVSADARPLALAAGEERAGIDFTLPLVETATIEGGVVTPPDIAPEAVQLLLVATGQAGAAGLIGPGLLTRESPNANGAFSFEAVPPGRYTLTARAALGSGRRGGRGRGGRAVMAFQSSRGGPPMILDSPGNDAPVYWATTELTIDGEDVSGVVLALQPGMTLSGRVEFEGTAAPPEDLSDVRVSLTPAPVAGTAVSMGVPSTTLDADGRFSITNVTPGRYRVAGRVPGQSSGFRLQSWTLRSAVFNGVDALDFPLDIGPNENIADAVLTFTDLTQEVTGTLQDPAGRPAPDFTIVVFAADPRYWTPASRRIRTTRPGTDGAFRVEGLPAGDYRIAAVTDIGPEETNDPAFLEQLAAASVPFTLAEGGTWVQDLRISGGGH